MAREGRARGRDRGRTSLGHENGAIVPVALALLHRVGLAKVTAAAGGGQVVLHLALALGAGSGAPVRFERGIRGNVGARLASAICGCAG